MRDFEKVVLVLSIVKEVVNIAKREDISLVDKLQQALYLKDWNKLIQVPSLRSQLMALCVSTIKSSRTWRKVMLKELKWKMQCVILHDVHDNERQILNRLDSTTLFLSGQGKKRKLDADNAAASAAKGPPVNNEKSPSFFRTSSTLCGDSSLIKLEINDSHYEHAKEVEVQESECTDKSDFVSDSSLHIKENYKKKLHLSYL